MQMGRQVRSVEMVVLQSTSRFAPMTARSGRTCTLDDSPELALEDSPELALDEEPELESSSAPELEFLRALELELSGVGMGCDLRGGTKRW